MIHISSLFVQVIPLEFRVIMIISSHLMNLIKENLYHHYRPNGRLLKSKVILINNYTKFSFLKSFGSLFPIHVF